MSGTSGVGIVLYRGERDQEFKNDDAKGLEELAPQFRIAWHLNSLLRSAERERDIARNGLSALSCAVILVDRSARILFANEMGDRLLAEGDGVESENGTLSAGTHGITRQLRDLCRPAAQRSGIEDRTIDSIKLPCRSSTDSHHAIVAPAVHGQPWAIENDGNTTALVFISPVRSDRPPNESLLRHLDGLTAAEAAVLSLLAAGKTTEEIQTARRYTRATVQWYIKQVMAKAGCRRRAELAAQVARALASVFPENQRQK